MASAASSDDLQECIATFLHSHNWNNSFAMADSKWVTLLMGTCDREEVEKASRIQQLRPSGETPAVILRLWLTVSIRNVPW